MMTALTKVLSRRFQPSTHKSIKIPEQLVLYCVIHSHFSLSLNTTLSSLQAYGFSPSPPSPPAHPPPASTTLDDSSCYLPSNGTYDVDLISSDKILSILKIIGQQATDSSKDNFKNRILTTQHHNDLNMAYSEISKNLKQIERLSNLLCNPKIDIDMFGNSSDITSYKRRFESEFVHED